MKLPYIVSDTMTGLFLLGVAPSSDSQPTSSTNDASPLAGAQQSLLGVARVSFAESGYADTSIEAVAARTNLSVEDFRRHFSSKLELYLAVFDHTEEFFFERIRMIVGTPPTVAAGVEAALDQLLWLTNSAPDVAGFFSTVSAELSQNAALKGSRQVHWPGHRAFVEELVRVGIAQGELATGDRLVAADTLMAMMVGLWQISSLTPVAQSGATEGLKRLMTRGLLVRAPTSDEPPA